MKTNEKNNTGRTALQKRILLQYETLNDFAARIGISIDKLDEKEEFTLEDILTIRKEFNLNEMEIMEYFFPDYKPTEEKTIMISLITLESIIRGLEHIEDGLNAMDLMFKGNIREVGDTVTNEVFQDAYSFIMDQIYENVMGLRADLTSKYFITREIIRKA